MNKLTFVPLGYEQITDTDAAFGLTVPNGATSAVITAEAQDVRYRDDGIDPTASIGMPLAKGLPLQYSGTLSKITFIAQTNGAILNVSYYR